MSSPDAFSRVRVLCVGDVMLDRFVAGTVKRISPESPVPVLSVHDNNVVPGGAANVARNISALGGHCTLIGVIGRDRAAEELRLAFQGPSNIEIDLIEAPNRPTTEKIRFVAHGQHMLRTDTENNAAIDPSIEQAVIDAIRRDVHGHDVLVLSDYAKGVLTDTVVREAIGIAQAANIPVIVDPKSAQVERYAGATVITPNAKEAFEASGIDPSDNDALAIEAGRLMLERGALQSVLVTRAHRGMTLVTKDGHERHIRACAREVFDVVGAGDTVVATLALSLGSGQSIGDAAELANVAAGIVVGKRGTATVTYAELMETLHAHGRGGLQSLEDKILTLDQAKQQMAVWKSEGRTAGFTNGCFDILHVGHLSILGFAKSQCGHLIVGVNSDASVKRLKGSQRPINPQWDRAMVLAGLAAVDAVVIFEEDTPLDLIRQLLPDVLIKGADYTVDKIVGAQEVLAHGGRVLTCPLVPDRSTTRVVNLLRESSPS